ncbi:MAG: glycosyltransferase, partial [Myxococcales bacterium]|nr:glycosyltransferase [Myxococcales bacterium]
MAEAVVRCAAADGEGEAEGSREGVLFVGRLIRQKGVDDLLRAVAALGGAIPVAIAGDGPERPRLERLARALGVPARFHGFVEPDARDR